MTIEAMRISLALAVVVGCGGPDAAPDAMPDAAPTLDCRSYCNQIQANCTEESSQYPDGEHCVAACASFTVGTSTVNDMSGDTLGCRIYYSGAPSRGDPATHCAHAGPGGDHFTASPPAACSGGDVCASFCALQIMACGSLEAPLPGNPRAPSGNPLYQYRNLAGCIENCATFDKTHAYSTAATGDSLACRMLHATRAALNLEDAKTECAYSGFIGTGPCEGPPLP